MKSAVITGANGFVGSAVTRFLSLKNIRVFAVVRKNAEHLDELKKLSNVTIIYCNMDEYNSLPSLINETDIDVFFHFAWTGSSGPMRADEKVQLNNVQYTCDAVRACSKMKIKRFIFASSIMKYEVEALMKTDKPISINTLYCTSKITADYMARAIADSLNIEYISGIISNIYGPGEISPRLINSSIRKFLIGDHLSFSAGEQLYDFIYIDDAANAFISIAEKGFNNKSYYIGSLHPSPLKNFLIEMRDVVSPNTKIGLGEIPFSGISLTYSEFDINAIKNDTGFIPSTNFRTGIKETETWIRSVNKGE